VDRALNGDRVVAAGEKTLKQVTEAPGTAAATEAVVGV
jgi:hypothetical protein